MAETTSMTRSQDRSMQEPAFRVWPFRSGEQSEGDPSFQLFPVDIGETEDAFLLLADLPGVSKAGMEVRLSDNQLTITGRVTTSLEEAEQAVLQEVSGAGYRRSFTLSDAVDPERITAEIRNGVLKVVLAKAERVKPRMVPISA